MLTKQPRNSSHHSYGAILTSCPVCHHTQTSYVFTHQQYPVHICHGCQSLFLNPQPSDEILGQLYSENYFLGGSGEQAETQRLRLKEATAQLYLKQLIQYSGSERGRLLEIGCGQGEFLAAAEKCGYEVTGVEYSEHAVQIARGRLQNGQVITGELERAQFPAQSFDVVVAFDLIEHVRDPQKFMRELHRILKPCGTVMLVTISLDTWTAQLLKHNWMEFKIEHLVYFTHNSLQTLLHLAGFQDAIFKPAYKILNPEYILEHFQRYPVPFFTGLLRLGYRFLPASLKQKALKLTGSGVIVMGRAGELKARRKLSIIVPAYDEGNTFTTLMDRLLTLELPQVDREIIIVESNSKDGTRQQALQYQDHPEIKLVLQDHPRGKGNAVREGFQHATGDIILIQDADLEYDIHDYPTLLEPLLAGHYPFVLGSRHSDTKGTWNMRHFEGSPIISSTMNLGHVIFRTLLNILYRQKLKDPFTMYKVFYRDCIYGLQFEANRFDFDFELVIKLLRKGYRPLEIPISYRSRAYSEGKKVSFLRDPLTWLRALVKFRFAALYEDRFSQH